MAEILLDESKLKDVLKAALLELLKEDRTYAKKPGFFKNSSVSVRDIDEETRFLTSRA